MVTRNIFDRAGNQNVNVYYLSKTPESIWGYGEMANSRSRSAFVFQFIPNAHSGQSRVSSTSLSMGDFWTVIRGGGKTRHRFTNSRCRFKLDHYNQCLKP